MIPFLQKMRVAGEAPSMKKVLEVAGLRSAAWYGKERRSGKKKRPGPKPAYSDEAVLRAVEAYLEDPLFAGEGYIKLKKRIRTRYGVEVGKDRLLRILRENGLLAGERPEPNGSSRVHDGAITTDRPDKLWALDIKEWRCADGKLYTFTVIDHYNSEVIAERSSRRVTQEVAADVLRMAIEARFGELTPKICASIRLYLRTDHGSRFTAGRFEDEMEHFGMEWGPAFVRSPECNGVIERYHGTLKEQLGHLIARADREEASALISAFAKKYNEEWMLHRLGLLTPLQQKSA